MRLAVLSLRCKAVRVCAPCAGVPICCQLVTNGELRISRTHVSQAHEVAEALDDGLDLLVDADVPVVVGLV
jgi:hypothetical protein